MYAPSPASASGWRTRGLDRRQRRAHVDIDVARDQMADRTRSRAGAVARDPPASQRGIRARREGGKARRLFRAPYLDDVLDGRDELVSRQVPWVVLGADAARKRLEEHQRGSPLRVRRREYRRHRAAFPEREQRGALAANRVDHRTHVVHPCLDPPERRGSVRQPSAALRSEEHTSELQSREKLVCRLLLEKKK